MPEMKIQGVVIENAELLHPKMIGVIEWFMAKESDHGLERIIVKHKDGPKGVFGKYFPDLNCFILNLEHCLEDAVERARNEKDDILSLAGMVWLSQIWGIGHEFHHGVAFTTDKEAMLENEEWLKGEEEEADAYADECIIEIARTRPDLIEPVALGEMPFFGVEVMARIVNSIQKGEDWATTHRDMNEKGEIYAGKNFGLASLREYLRLGKGGPDWEEAPIQLEIEKPKAMAVGTVAPQEIVPEEAPAPHPAEPVVMNQEAEALDYQGDLNAVLDMGAAPEFIPEDVDLDYYTAVDAPMSSAATSAGVEVSQPMAHPDFVAQAPQGQTVPADDPVTTTVYAIFNRVVDHIFEKIWDSRGLWKNGKELWTPINISDIPGSEIVVAYRTNKDTGRRVVDVPANGVIIGRTFSEHTLPGYDIIMKINGTRCARRIIVQNPWKRDFQGNLKKFAIAAQAGEKIVQNIDIDGKGREAYKSFYRNGVWTLYDN